MASFTLRPMAADDVDACARVAGLAFQSDRHTQLKALDPDDPYDHEQGMKGGLQYWLGSSPSGIVESTVAVSNSTSEIVGWVAWGFHRFNSAEADAKHQAEIKELTRSPSSKDDPLPEISTEYDPSKSMRQNLEGYTGQDMSNWMKKLMPPGTRCMYICSIAIHPDYQGSGIGSALIKQGTDRADKEDVSAWVHASEAGANMFGRHGFREVGNLVLDLDHWNQHNLDPPEGQGNEWGKYTFKYMQREPLRT